SLAVLATLAFIAVSGWPGARFWRLELSTIGLPLAYGLIVAPWLTMVARGPLGGVVFAFAIPLVVGLVLSVLDPLDLFIRPSFWTTMTAVPIVGGVLGWQALARLEALDTHRDIELPKMPGASRAKVSSRRNPLWALVTKELRLQQLTVFIALLSFAAVLIARWYYNLAPRTNLDLTYALSIMHLALVPILAGALASSEERRLGTLEWQVLQPIATWKQWLIKATVVVALSVVVSLVPLALLYGSYNHAIWVLRSV